MASLFCCILTGCIPVFAYPRFWDFARKKPQDSDLVGSYKVLELRLPEEQRRLVGGDPRITLRRDHTADLIALPEFDVFGKGIECIVSGTATWELYNSTWDWYVEFKNYHATNKGSAGECKRENTIWGSPVVLSRHAPDRLYDYVGDPDSDTGIEYHRFAK